MALKPDAFQRCFQAWICDVIPADPKDSRHLLAIDGKACRGLLDAAKGLGLSGKVKITISDQLAIEQAVQTQQQICNHQ